MKKFNQYEIDNTCNGMTLDSYLKEKLEISARNRQKLIFNGFVLVNGRKAHSKRKLKNGDVVYVPQQEDNDYGVEPEYGEVNLLYEDESVMVMNKQAGILVHPAGQTKNGTLANFVAGYFKKQGKVITVRPIHRLDRDTSGCVIFAKTAIAQTKLTAALNAGHIHRTYAAIVTGEFSDAEKNGRISAPIGKNPLYPNRRQVTEKGKSAITNYEVIKEFGQDKGQTLSLLNVNLETGRTHQIRVHMAHIGHAVLGDRMYGRASKLISRQALHASRVEFTHPVSNKKVTVQAELPPDFLILQ